MNARARSAAPSAAQVGRIVAALTAATIGVAVAGSASAGTIFEQTWLGTMGGAQSDGVGFVAFEPFELPTSGNSIVQIIWWGVSSSDDDFAVRFHAAIANPGLGFVPDLNPFYEFMGTVNSVEVNAFTDRIYWVNLPQPAILPSGPMFISIEGDVFKWWKSNDNHNTTPFTLARSVSTGALIPQAYEVAFVLNDTVEPVPEPSTGALALASLLGLALCRAGQTLRSRSD